MGKETGVAMEITGFQLEQQTTHRWGTTEPYPTADGHGDLRREYRVSDTFVSVQLSEKYKTKFSAPKNVCRQGNRFPVSDPPV